MHLQLRRLSHHLQLSRPCWQRYWRNNLRLGGGRFFKIPTKKLIPSLKLTVSPENGWLEYKFCFGMAYFQGWWFFQICFNFTPFMGKISSLTHIFKWVETTTGYCFFVFDIFCRIVERNRFFFETMPREVTSQLCRRKEKWYMNMFLFF